jgi:sugar lactone lactonase YvrE
MEIPSQDPLEIVTAAIERHRDDQWHGGPVSDENDRRLYDVAVWVRDNQQEIDSKDDDKGVTRVVILGVMRIEGNAYDIDRVIQACRDALRRIEIERRDPKEKIAVLVPGPDPTHQVRG